ncbi:hypothetical protein [Culturomica sp.]|uniref:hypothetical protein n=1 Tax=Culturomica sp. TaxID=1926652 RepID=UPI0025803588|nr:hypothetical protein [Culturomica sp.]
MEAEKVHQEKNNHTPQLVRGGTAQFVDNRPLSLLSQITQRKENTLDQSGVILKNVWGCFMDKVHQKGGASSEIIQRLKLKRSSSGREIDFTGISEVKSREASRGIYIKAGRVYKIFGKTDAAQKEYNETANVNSSFGVPIADPIDYYPATIDDTPGEKVGVFESTELKGKFFQLSKGGELGSYVGKLTDKVELDWVLRDLVAARNAKLSDPQGFLEDTGLHPIIFIDINTASNPHPTIVSLIKSIEQKLSVQ